LALLSVHEERKKKGKMGKAMALRFEGKKVGRRRNSLCHFGGKGRRTTKGNP